MSRAAQYLEQLRWYLSCAVDHHSGICYYLTSHFEVTDEEDRLDAYDAFTAGQLLAGTLMARSNDNQEDHRYIADWPPTHYMLHPGRTPRRVDLVWKLVAMVAAHPEQFNAIYAEERRRQGVLP